MQPIKFIYRLIIDLYRTYFSFPKVKQESYAFIVHPRGYFDVISNVPFLKILPRNFVMRYFHLVWPFTVSKISGLKSLETGQPIDGWVIGVPIFAHQMIEDRNMARKKINKAIRLAKNKGAKVIGLGGLTGSVMDGGAGLREKDGVLITAGRAYTASIVKKYADDAVKKFGLDKEKTIIAIVGASGGVGRAVTRLFAQDKYKKLILIDLERKLEKLYQEVKESELTEVSHQIGKIKEADIIITATNAPEAVVQSVDIKSGAIIIDDAQPSDISPDVIENRDDVLIIEAGVIAYGKDIALGTNFRLANKNELYCCLGEVMILAASGWKKEYAPGDIQPEIVKEMSVRAKEMGFDLAPYQAFGRLVPPEQLEKINQILKQNNQF